MATNFAKASFQEIYDLHTSTNTSTIIGVHTPVSTRVHQYLNGFFTQFKQFRYDGCSMVFIPVSQLPVDPLQVGTEAGYVDPRDLVNPILHAGMHGESLGGWLQKVFELSSDKSFYDGLDVLNSDSTAGSDPTYTYPFEEMYYTALASPAWNKAHVQRGFRKGRLVPLAYNVRTNQQLMPVYGTRYPGALSSTEYDTADDDGPQTGAYMSMGTSSGMSTERGNLSVASDSSAMGLIGDLGYRTAKAGNNSSYTYTEAQVFSGGLSRLGWLDTLQNYATATAPTSENTVDYGSSWTALPKLYMYLVMLPPCYMQKMYFRVVLTHHYSFRHFRSSKGPFSQMSLSHQAYDGPAIWGEQVTPDLGSPYEPASAMVMDDTITAMNGEVQLITDGVS